MSNATSPPDGLVVLDFTHTLAGPYCKMLMGTSGAKVVEIEEPEHGDRPRPGSAVGLSLAIDLKTPAGARVPVR